MKRKIAAILAADVVEYSRLVAEDEEETLRRLVSYRSVFDDFVTKADGRIFNTAGDAVLAEFPSAVDALRAAIDIQESLRTRNMAYPPSRHMQFRMGLTVGDVVEREGDLLGDGVNIAARSLLGAVFGGDAAGPGPQDPQLRNRCGVNFRVNDPPLVLGEMQLLWNAKKGDPGLDGKLKKNVKKSRPKTAAKKRSGRNARENNSPHSCRGYKRRRRRATLVIEWQGSTD